MAKRRHRDPIVNKKKRPRQVLSKVWTWKGLIVQRFRGDPLEALFIDILFRFQGDSGSREKQKKTGERLYGFKKRKKVCMYVRFELEVNEIGCLRRFGCLKRQNNSTSAHAGVMLKRRHTHTHKKLHLLEGQERVGGCSFKSCQNCTR